MANLEKQSALERLKGQWAWITGASSGIGKASALKLAEAGVKVALLARSVETMNVIAKELLKNGAPDVEVLPIDLSQPEKMTRDLDHYLLGSQRGRLVSENTAILINNAGLALGTETFEQNSDDSILQVINTNVLGLTLLTKRLVPALKHNRGHIVNLGSVAGHWTYSGGTVYCASKAAVRALSEGFRLDLHGTGVRVTNIEPGMVETGFSRVRLGDVDKADALYRGMTPLSADDIADTICWCLARPEHVNVQELMIFPTDQSGVGVVHRKEPS